MQRGEQPPQSKNAEQMDRACPWPSPRKLRKAICTRRTVANPGCAADIGRVVTVTGQAGPEIVVNEHSRSPAPQRMVSHARQLSHFGMGINSGQSSANFRERQATNKIAGRGCER